MFNKDEIQTPKDAETIIGQSVKVKGDFAGKGNLIVEGEVEGNIKTEGMLIAKSGSKIFANIKAKDAIIGGEVSGNVLISNSLELTPSAKITGDIHAMSINMAKGAIFNGKCSMGPRPESEQTNSTKENE
jgi:cytoskeletal protein CcmA (bactofilin family)